MIFHFIGGYLSTLKVDLASKNQTLSPDMQFNLWWRKA